MSIMFEERGEDIHTFDYLTLAVSLQSQQSPRPFVIHQLEKYVLRLGVVIRLVG